MQKPIYTNEESKTFDQVINQVSEGIIRRSIFNDLPQELYEDEIEDIDSLKSSLDEFTNHIYARPIKNYKCEEITMEFIEAYKRFLQLKAPYEDGTIPAIAHLMTLGRFCIYLICVNILTGSQHCLISINVLPLSERRLRIERLFIQLSSLSFFRLYNVFLIYLHGDSRCNCRFLISLLAIKNLLNRVIIV